ncbi:DUF4124 domain-containing protein [Alteromonas sp. 1_MG-2023]|uniref:DUF4124 domain-containing protein n=1 Tax=Alteromonas sp. 1_MG-2023 TaxID=3062669 RepID=UPI0026E2D4CD|nr:DUF4124 domain-containing protein [Alteromonas sp. 1_MG-2023]MDO6569087.1 DUF4124 domain-containing protein [Alteromonas sp. 1_MG-2023]
MKYNLLIILLTCSISGYASEIYKCKDSDGKLAFSDSPCPTKSSQEVLNIEKKSWESRLQSLKPSSINIIEIDSEEGETTIKYEFKTIADSNAFLKQVRNLSKMPVALMKLVQPKAGGAGRGEIKASNKLKPLPF